MAWKLVNFGRMSLIQSAALADTTIYVSSADGFRYWIDGALVGDVWIYTFEQEWTTTVALAPGEHTLKMEYFANVGHSACHLKWSGPSVSKQVVPASALSH